MRAPRPGDPFYLDLEGTVIAGRYRDVDPPNRMLIEWDRQGTDTTTPSLIEITFAPTGNGTAMTVQFHGVSAEDAALHRQLWRQYLDRIAAVSSEHPTPAPPHSGAIVPTSGPSNDSLATSTSSARARATGTL